MLPKFSDLFEEIALIFNERNQDKALIKMLALFNDYFNIYDSYESHNLLLNWQKRGLPANECKILLNSDSTNFKLYIAELEISKKEKLVTIVKNYYINANIKNIHLKLTTLLRDIAAEKAKLPTSSDLLYEKELEYDKLYGARLLISQHKKCLYCSNPIKLTKQLDKEKMYSNYHIVRLKGTTNEEFEKIVALCNDCYCNFLENYETDLNLQEEFVEKKKASIIYDKKLELQENSKLEDEIYIVLKSLKDNFSSIITSKQEKYNISVIKKKIPYDTELFYKVKSDCDICFGYIQKTLSKLDKDTTKTYKNLREQINNYFKNLDNLEKDQTIIYNDIVDWVLSKAKLDSKYRLASEKVVSFFVQICEVFYEISK